MSIKQPLALFINGPQGAGKGTQGEMWRKKYGFAHVVAGEILGSKAGTDPEYKKLIEDCQNQGMLVPDKVTVDAVATHVLKTIGSVNMILDGCMRTPGQTKLMLEFVRSAGYIPVVIFLVLPEQIAKQRMEKRGRSDDKPDVIRTRLDNYNTRRDSILGQIVSEMLPIGVVDASQCVDDVFCATYLYVARNHNFCPAYNEMCAG